MEADIREREYCGKVKVAKFMKEVSKEVLGRPWDIDTCKFAFEIMNEALIRATLNCGGVKLPGFMTIKITRRPPSRNWNVRAGMVTDKPGYNICTAKMLPSFKEQVKALQTWYVDDGKINETKIAHGINVDEGEE